MMTEAMIVAFITGGLAIISNVVVASANNSKTVYRIDQLEQKVEKHNNLIDRVVKLESSDQAQWKWIDSFKDKL